MLLILFRITTFLTIIFSLSLGIYTIFRNPKSLVHRLWFFTSLAVAVWGIGWLLTTLTDKADLVKSYLVIVYLGATLIPILFLHFITKFLIINKKKLLIIGYFGAFILLCFILFTHYLITGVNYSEDVGYYEQVNLLPFSFYLIYFLFFTIYSFYLLIVGYRHTEGFKKKQLLFLILATIFGLGGGITNFIMDLTGIYPFGQFFVFLYPILITYGIFLKKY